MSSARTTILTAIAVAAMLALGIWALLPAKPAGYPGRAIAVRGSIALFRLDGGALRVATESHQELFLLPRTLTSVAVHVALTPDTHCAYVARNSGHLEKWNVAEEKMEWRVPGHYFSCLEVNPLDGTVYTGGVDNESIAASKDDTDYRTVRGVVYQWSLDGHRLLRRELSFMPTAIALAHNGREWYCGGYISGVVRYRPDSSTIFSALQCPDSKRVMDVACQVNGPFVAACTWDDVCVWDTRSEERQVKPLLRIPTAGCSQVEFNPDCQDVVFVRSADGIYCCHLPSGQMDRIIGEFGIECFSHAPSGTNLLTARRGIVARTSVPETCGCNTFADPTQMP